MPPETRRCPHACRATPRAGRSDGRDRTRPPTRGILRLGLCAALLVCRPAAGAAQTAGDTPSIHFGGYVQFDYLAPFGDRAGEPETFRFRRVRLLIGGSLIENIDWSVSAEVTTTPMLRDAYVVFKHLPAANVRIGQFVMPYGQEQYVFSSNTLAFTERTLTTMMPSRDAGMMVSNARPFGGWFTYAAAVTNGTGMNTRDDNGAKDGVVRLTATPPSVPGLQVSVSGARGEQLSGMRTRRGADVSFERRTFHVAGEFAHERIENVHTRDGFYAFGSWRWYPRASHRSFHHLEFGSRYGRITGADPREQWDFSANYYVQPAIRFMCDYTVLTGRTPGGSRSSLQARANFRF